MKCHGVAAALFCAIAMTTPPVSAQGEGTEEGAGETSDASHIRARDSNRYLDPDVIRCQRRREAGSFRERRICLTNRQWDEIYRSGNRDAQRIQDMGRLYAGPDG